MSEHTSETVERGGFDRREALKKAAVAGGIVWAAPMIMSSPARAQATPCTPKCAPDTSRRSVSPGTTVTKLGCVDPNAPARSGAIHRPGVHGGDRDHHVPVYWDDAHLQRNSRLPVHEPQPRASRLSSAPAASSSSHAPTSTGP